VKITDKQGHIKMLRLIKILLLIFTAMPCTLYALDKKGNYESKDEQDKHIAATLKKMAVEMNSQAPIMLDADTQFRSALALNKTISFTYWLGNLNSNDLSSSALNKLNETVLSNMNENACKVQATRTLIDLGVSYVYIYFGNDDRLITQVVLNKYICN
jgi:hypothetical protein